MKARGLVGRSQFLTSHKNCSAIMNSWHFALEICTT